MLLRHCRLSKNNNNNQYLDNFYQINVHTNGWLLQSTPLMCILQSSKKCRKQKVAICNLISMAAHYLYQVTVVITNTFKSSKRSYILYSLVIICNRYNMDYGSQYTKLHNSKTTRSNRDLANKYLKKIYLLNN